MPLHRIAAHGRHRLVAESDGPPDGPPVLLWHGGGQTRQAWSTLARELARRGYHAVTIDMRGHGDSDWPEDGDYGADAFAADVAAVARRCSRPPILVGAALGGAACLLAAGRPTSARAGSLASALVLVDAAPRLAPDGLARIRQFMDASAAGFATVKSAADSLARYRDDDQAPLSPEALATVLRRRPDRRWHWHWDPALRASRDGVRRPDLEHDMETAASLLMVPTLIVHGGRSDLVTADAVAALQRLIPHAQAVEVREARHRVVGETNDPYNLPIIDYVSRIFPPARPVSQGEKE